MIWLTIVAALLAGTAAPAGGGIAGPAASSTAPNGYNVAAAASAASGGQVAVLGAIPSGDATSDDGAANPAADPLTARIDAWIAALSAEEGFESWREAAWRKYPLGPGQHGWVVILEAANGGGEIGYLVVLAKAEGGYALGEYGLGDSPLFSYHTLERALRSEEVAFTGAATIERRYAGAMHAVWKVSEGGVTRFADAKTGAWLPIAEVDVGVAESKLSGNAWEVSQPRKRLHIIEETIADPYMSIAWLDTDAVGGVQDWTTFVDWLGDRAGEAMYAASAFDGKALTPIGVAGYHWWSAEGGQGAVPGADTTDPTSIRGFVALDHEGFRYVPLERLLAEGSFH
ncbi:hypothetical protein MO973_11855 [Paenibacillus sp. TRM 82003]|nr:hypothetical protein [Paenibacillus sp. TRM 82003]